MYDLKKLTPEEISENQKLIDAVRNGGGLPFLESDKDEIDWAHVDPYPRTYLKLINKKVYRYYLHPYTYLKRRIVRRIEYSRFNKYGHPLN